MNKLLILFIFILSFSFTFGQDENKLETEYVDVPFAIIERAPIYPGCKVGDNGALKKCMSERIDAFVSSNFNMKLIDSLELPPDIYRISVQFKIDKSGNVIDVRARATHPSIEEEAIRVVSSLPKFTPGEQKGETVAVIYAIPIQFEVAPKIDKEDSKKSKRKKRT